MSSITLNNTVGDTVASDYRTAEVFNQFGIDFCLGGGQTIKDVCAKKGVNWKKLENALDDIRHQDESEEKREFKDWCVDKLMKHIVNEHHQYVRDNIPLISKYTKKINKVHGHANLELLKISSIFEKLSEELTSHMNKEEQTLFPYIQKLARSEEVRTSIDSPSFFALERPIVMMELEHERVVKYIAQISDLSNGYSPPQGASDTWNVCYSKLNEFEEDLKKHIHLENNILFPEALAIEKRMAANNFLC